MYGKRSPAWISSELVAPGSESIVPKTHCDFVPPGCPAGSFGKVTSWSMPADRTTLSSLSPEYMNQPSCNCFKLLRQAIPCPLALALLSAGSSSAARMAMIAITTSNSISVKPSLSHSRVDSRNCLCHLLASPFEAEILRPSLIYFAASPSWPVTELLIARVTNWQSPVKGCSYPTLSARHRNVCPRSPSRILISFHRRLEPTLPAVSR